MNQQQEKSRSAILGGFGYVTAEDRAKWEQGRAQTRKEHPNMFTSFIGGMASGVAEISKQGLEAKLRAAHQVKAQQAEKDSAQGVHKAGPLSKKPRTIHQAVKGLEQTSFEEEDHGMEF